MRVWVCNPFDLLPGEGARLQRYGLLCRSLTEAGHRVVWWSSDFCHLSKRRRVSPGPDFGEVEIRLVPTRPYGRNISLSRVWSHLCYARMWRKLAEASGERPDLIVASLPPLGACEEAVAFARRVGCAVVVDLMDAWPEVFEQLVPRPFLAPLYRQAQRILDGATAVAGVGQTYLDLARSKRSSVPIHRCYHGIDLPTFSPERCAPVGVRLCYVGNLGVQYNLPELVEAVRLARARGIPATLDVAGDGPRRAWLESVCGEGIAYHGLLGQGELAGLMATCTVGVVPMRSSTWVAVPYKLADYCAAGLAIANGLGGECARLVEEYRCGEPYNPQAPRTLLALIEKWAREPHLLRSMQTASRRLAEARFDAARIYPRFVAWLENIAARRPAN